MTDKEGKNVHAGEGANDEASYQGEEQVRSTEESNRVGDGQGHGGKACPADGAKGNNAYPPIHRARDIVFLQK